MTILTDFYTEIREWIDDQDPTDALVDSWVRIAESRINDELRSTEQITRTYATFDDNCSIMPADWLEHIYVRVKGGRPFDYITPHDYWDLRPPPTYSPQPDPLGVERYPWPGKKMLYTTIGTTLFVWPPIDPEALTQVEICYFRAIQPLGTQADVVFTRYHNIYLNCALSAAAPYLVEDDRLTTFASLATAGIQKANDMARSSRWSGSPIAPRIRGFG